jgi:hypothetical protein
MRDPERNHKAARGHGITGRRLLECSPAVRTYRLIRPVVAFFTDERKTVVLPAGTLIMLQVRTEAPVGIARIRWKGRGIMVQRHDVDANALQLES